MEIVVVAGGGTMGAGIAFVAACAGFSVYVVEPDAGAQDRARARIAKEAERAQQPQAAANVQFFTSLPDGIRAAIAIEAVPETLELKRRIFRDLAAALEPQTLLATNTSSLSLEDIFAGTPHPERTLGLHFFNPPAQMQLVEIVYDDATADDTLARARSFVERIGKTPVLAADTPGFIVNRVARPYYLQALRAYEAGVAPFEDLDRLARGVGFRMGPFELMDLIGLDVNLATSESVYERTGAGRFEPLQTQRDLVAQGCLGRKTGSGFYDYSAGPPARDDELPALPAERNSDERIVILGYAGLALELREMLGAAYEHVDLWENEEILDEIPAGTTIVIDVGDGASDRTGVLAALDSLLPEETVLFADAYATDISAASSRLRFPQRLCGYGVLAGLQQQRVVEIADTEDVSDDTLELAQDLFESIGRRVALTEDGPGLFLGRTVGSIVNEAVCVVADDIASAGDVDLAMRLGTNYPQGPIAWGREIGGDRVQRILERVAAVEGNAFAPHRALRLIDVDETQLTQHDQDMEESGTGG